MALTFSNLGWSNAEYGYLTTEEGVNATLTLSEGDLFEIIEISGDRYIGSYGASYSLKGVDPQTNKTLLVSEFDYNGSPSISIFYGPLELTLEAPGTNRINILYKLIRVPNPQPVSQ